MGSISTVFSTLFVNPWQGAQRQWTCFNPPWVVCPPFPHRRKSQKGDEHRVDMEPGHRVKMRPYINKAKKETMPRGAKKNSNSAVEAQNLLVIGVRGSVALLRPQPI